MGGLSKKEKMNGLITGIVLPVKYGNLDKGPSWRELVDMLTTDVETEGKKQGYTRAAIEYEKAFREIEVEYEETKKLYESKINTYDSLADTLIEKLEVLERQKKNLEDQVAKKAKEVSEKYDIPLSQVQGSLRAGTLVTGTLMIDVLGIIYKRKERKLHEAEQQGYVEAKELYEKKISVLKSNLDDVKNKGTAKVKKLMDMISEIIDAIAVEQMKIAELKMLL